MRYDLELARNVSDRIRALSGDLVVCVSRHLELLCEDPLSLGRRATLPYLPYGQVYEFWCEERDGTPVFVAIFFFFKAGEQILRVHDITTRS